MSQLNSPTVQNAVTPSIFRIDENSFIASASTITFDEFSLSATNPSKVFQNIPGLGDVTVSFRTNFIGQTRSGSSVVTLSDSDPDGILQLDSGAPNVFTVDDSANPTSPVLSGSPIFNGPISILFSQPVATVGLTGGYFDAVGATTIEAYDANGNPLGSVVNTKTGLEFFGLGTQNGGNVIAGISFFITGNEPAGFAIDNVKFGTINVIKPRITLAVDPAIVTEDGTDNLVYTFTRTGDTTNALTVNYSITGTADSSDYTGATPGTGKTITFAAGETTKQITIDPTADTSVESNETVALTLTAGTDYTIGTTTAVTGIIRNDHPVISFSSPTFRVNENGDYISAVTIIRTGNIDGVDSVTVTPTNGTATAPGDFNSNPIIVNFANGETSKTIRIPIVNDTIVESTETVNLTLSNPSRGATLGSQQTAEMTIVDNDVSFGYSITDPNLKPWMEFITDSNPLESLLFLNPLQMTLKSKPDKNSGLLGLVFQSIQPLLLK